MDDTPDKNRRKLIQGGLALLVLPTIAGAGGMLLGTSILDALPKPPAPIDEGTLDLAKRVFFGSNGHFKVVPAFQELPPLLGELRPQYEMTKPTKDAVRSLENLVHLSKGHIELARTIPAHDLDGNLFLLGGPMRNMPVRALMGECGTSSSFVHNKSRRPLRLPLHFDIRSSVSNSAESHERVYRSEFTGAPLRPNVGVWTGASYEMPDLDEQGRPTEDYVVVTSMPNIFSRKALDAGHRVVAFSGTHGVGTRAIELLLRKEEILAEFNRLNSKHHGWQTVIYVDGVEDGGVTPTSIRDDVNAHEIHFDFHNAELIESL